MELLIGQWICGQLGGMIDQLPFLQPFVSQLCEQVVASLGCSQRVGFCELMVWPFGPGKIIPLFCRNPSVQNTILAPLSPVVDALSITRLGLCGSKSLFLFLSVAFFFSHTFPSVPLPWGVSVVVVVKVNLLLFVGRWFPLVVVLLSAWHGAKKQLKPWTEWKASNSTPVLSG